MHTETHVSVYSIPLYIYLSWSHGNGVCSTGQIHMAWSHGIAVHSLRCIHVCIFRSLYPTYLSVYPGIPCIHGCLCLCIQCIRVCIRQCISASIYRSPITEFILYNGPIACAERRIHFLIWRIVFSDGRMHIPMPEFLV